MAFGQSVKWEVCHYDFKNIHLIIYEGKLKTLQGVVFSHLSINHYNNLSKGPCRNKVNGESFSQDSLCRDLKWARQLVLFRPTNAKMHLSRKSCQKKMREEQRNGEARRGDVMI